MLGKLRNEPVYMMIGGRTKDNIPFYCTGPEPVAVREMGFWGSKVPLPYSPLDGFDSMQKNINFLKAHREKLGRGFPLMVDCVSSSEFSLVATRWLTFDLQYMSLNVQYAIQLAQRAIEEKIDITWWEEVLHPDDFDGREYSLTRQRKGADAVEQTSNSKLLCLGQSGRLESTSTRATASASSSRIAPWTSFSPMSCGWEDCPRFVVSLTAED